MPALLGQRVRRVEDPRLLRGEGRYVDDITLPGCLHVSFVRSPVAHAKITTIDVSAANAMRGARVFTGGDIDLTVHAPPPIVDLPPCTFRPFVASDRVRFVGEIVAVAVGDCAATALDAAELVDVDYQPLEVVTDIVDAARGEVLLFEELDTNVCVDWPVASPAEDLFKGCDVVASGTLVSQRIAACPLESRAAVAQWDENGRLEIWLSTQTPHQDRMSLVQMFGLRPEDVRVIAPDVGGAFGGKHVSVEEALVAWVARETGRPARWTEDRIENLVAMPHGRAVRVDFEIGGSADGHIEAMRWSILADAGAYPGMGAYLPKLTTMMASGAYRIPRIEVASRVVMTNTTPVAAVRGAGRPEAAQTVERAIDMFALECDLDPVELRRRNFIQPDAFPFLTATGAEYDTGDYERALDLVLEHAGYTRLREAQLERRRNSDSRQLGIGLCCYVNVTDSTTETEFGSVEIGEDGHAILKTGSFAQGQGHSTTFAQIASSRLGIPIDQIAVLSGDTDTVPRGTGTYASKSTQIGGAAAERASMQVVERARQLVAEELEASEDDVILDLDRGVFHVVGVSEPALSWQQLAARLAARGELSQLHVEVDFKAPRSTFPFGTHLAVVEVDTDTGAVELVRLIALDDAGRIINPLLAEGQLHGGLFAGIAQALYEEITFDEDGNPQNATLLTYGFTGAEELPHFELLHMETPTSANELGAKGLGESATIGATPAVQNAVIDALSPYGVRHLDMPLSGERIWRACHERSRG
jgi:aerobic carbon-monoxide dehydrogenase large subunit